MNGRRFFDPSLPQTLQIAVILQYINAVFAVLDLLGASAPLYRYVYLFELIQGAAAYGIANNKKWGYWLGVSAALLELGTYLLIAVHYRSIGGLGGIGGVLSLAFSIALVALLLHPISRGYQRIWFR